MTEPVVAVIGAGGIGTAIARRQAHGRKVVLGDLPGPRLEETVSSMLVDGIDATSRPVDVTDRASVVAFFDDISRRGELAQLVHTAGLGPQQGTADDVVAVNLIGVAHVLHTLAPHLHRGMSGVVILSAAARFAAVPTEDEEAALAQSTIEDLSRSAYMTTHSGDARDAYRAAKRAALVRVAAASVRWGTVGARLNSISPGAVWTEMGRLDLDDASSNLNRAVAKSALGRAATAQEIAAVAAFLLGPESSFVTGADVLVDGGMVPAHAYGLGE